MPRNTKIKLRAGTQSAWTATAKTQSLSAAAVTGSGENTVVRYTATGHTYVVNDVVTITGFGVSSGNNPYNIAGGVISAVASGTFDISVASGTTGGTSTGTGTAKLVVLDTGEAGVETDTQLLKIGDGTTDWAGLRYINKPFYYVLNSQQSLGTGTGEQDLFDDKFTLVASTTYQFEISCAIQTNTTSKNISFGFYQTGMTAFSTCRYSWVVGTRADSSTIHYSLENVTFAGNSPATSTLIDLYPADANPVVFFTIRGIIRTGSGTSYFQPRVQFSATPGTTTVLSGSYVKIDPLGPSSLAFTGSWV